MGDTWGIPGPVFLGLFVVLVVVACLVGPLARWNLDRRAARAAQGTPVTPSVEELAMLAGGRRRLLETAIARLVDGGVLRVSHQRHLTFTGRPPVGDLDEAVVGAVESHPAMSTNGILLRVHDSSAVRAIEDGARAKGLLHDPAAVRRSKHLAVGALGLVELLGVLRLAAGIARGAPEMFLVFLVAVVTVVTVATLVLVPVHRPTPLGRATLAAYRSPQVMASARTPGVPATAFAGTFGAAGLVALGGIASFPDPVVSALLAPRSPFAAAGAGAGAANDTGRRGSPRSRHQGRREIDLTVEQLPARRRRCSGSRWRSRTSPRCWHGPTRDGRGAFLAELCARTGAWLLLRAKRRRVLTGLLPPEVHDHLGAELGPRLDAWITAHPRREGTSMHADAEAFVAALRADGVLARARRRWGVPAWRPRWR